MNSWGLTMPLGIVPAQQGLDPDRALGPQRHDGLVVEPELAVVERLAQAPLGGGRMI
jgi:hypothetical protein